MAESIVLRGKNRQFVELAIGDRDGDAVPLDLDVRAGWFSGFAEVAVSFDQLAEFAEQLRQVCDAKADSAELDDEQGALSLRIRAQRVAELNLAPVLADSIHGELFASVGGELEDDAGNRLEFSLLFDREQLPDVAEALDRSLGELRGSD